MKAPIPLLILLHAVVVHCLKVVSKRGSGKSRTLTTIVFFVLTIDCSEIF